MRTKILIVAAVALPWVLPTLGVAQVGEPASTNAPGREYPRIDSELRATFQFSAPDAEAVQVSVGGETYDLTRDADRMWTVTTPPLVPGFHYYSIVVDGASVSDPNSETFFGSTRMMSGIEVPAPDQKFYAIRDVPHGEVRSRWYYSEFAGGWRQSFV